MSIQRYKDVPVPGMDGWGFEKDGNGEWVRHDDHAALIERIHMAACYGSEENTDARAEMLLLIGKLCRGEVNP